MANAAGLLARIEDFTVGGPEGHEVFLTQLAEENDWSRDTAARAWREYLRFLALASSSPELPRVPSPAVDAVWHLHLADTSYTDGLQPLLGGVLGHQQDGSASDQQYRETIAAYTASFGPPPRDLWPRPAGPTATPIRRRRRRPWLVLPYIAVVIALVVLLGVGHPITIVVLGAGALVWLWRQVQRERAGPLATAAPSQEPACQSSWNGSLPFS